MGGKGYYGGWEVVEMVEKVGMEGVKKVLGGEYGKVEGECGGEGKGGVVVGVLKGGDRLMGLKVEEGGEVVGEGWDGGNMRGGIL